MDFRIAKAMWALSEKRLLGAAAILVAALLVVLYSALGDLFGLIDGLTTAIVSVFSLSRYPFAAEFLSFSLRSGFFLFPALALLTWGVGTCITTRQVTRILNTCVRHAGSLALIVAAAATIAASLISAFVIEYHPITFGDEYCYLFHTKLLQTGRFYAELPPEHHAFRNSAFVFDGRWYGIAFGGHPLLLTLGYRLGMTHLVPALFAGVSILLVFLLVSGVFDRGLGLLAAIMSALSPLFLLYHSTLLPEPSSLVLLLLFLLLVHRGTQKPRWSLLVLAALSYALAVVTRPQTALFVGAPIGVWLLLRRGVPARQKTVEASILGGGAIVGVACLLGYAHVVSGEPYGAHASPGYHRYGGAMASLGFGELGRFVTALFNTAISVVKLNFVLLGWPISWAALAIWVIRGSKRAWEYVLGAAASGIILFYFFRAGRQEQFYVEAGLMLTILSAVGLARLYRSTRNGQGHSRVARGLVAFVLASYFLGSISIWPFQIAYFKERSSFERTVLSPIEEAGIRHAIVFLEGLPDEYASSVGRNSPDLDDDVILARIDDVDEIPSIRRHFPDRGAYRLLLEDIGDKLKLVPYTDHFETLTHVHEERYEPTHPSGGATDDQDGVPMNAPTLGFGR